MPRRAVHWKVLLAVLSAGVLSGCITSIAPARFLPREAFGSVTQVALAVGADGLKHYAWTECFGSGDDYTCVLVYTRSATGGVLYSHTFIAPIGTFARNPDVAVTSSGEAYVVRSVCTDSFTCVDYWSMFPADPDGVIIDTELLHQVETASQGPPLIEARENDVYAAYMIEVAGNTRLRYRQLSGGGRLGYVDVSTLPPSYPSLAIDSDGDLHAVWVRNPVNDTVIAYSSNDGGIINSFTPATTFDGGSDYEFTRPDLALDNDDRVYLAYVLDDGGEDTIRVRCLDLPGNCYSGATPLNIPQADGPWHVWDNVNIELIGPQPNVVFAASHDSLTHSEVWWYRPASGANTAPTRVTNTVNESEAEPLIVRENSSAGDVAVIGWRAVKTLVLGTQAVDSGYCYGDVFVLYNSPANTRQVFEDAGTCDNEGFDLAANGGWVAGVWADAESAQIQAHAAWTAFNAHLVNVPLVRR